MTSFSPFLGNAPREIHLTTIAGMQQLRDSNETHTDSSASDVATESRSGPAEASTADWSEAHGDCFITDWQQDTSDVATYRLAGQ